MKSKKLHFKLLTRNWKMKCYTLSYQLEVKKWKVSFQVANSKVRVFLFPFRVTKSKLEKKLHFELVTPWLCSFVFCFWVTNSKLENKIFHFELLTRSLNFYFFNFSFLSNVFLLKHMLNRTKRSIKSLSISIWSTTSEWQKE